MGEQRERVSIEEALAQARWLRSLAASLVADASAADDVVQETWIAALRHPPPGGERLRPWLARVARNVARNVRRGARRRSAREAARAEERSHPSPDRIAEEAEAQKLLAEAVAALGEPLRAVVVLRYFRGHDSGEIARTLGIPAGTVRWRLMKALERLRSELDRRSGGEREHWLRALAPFSLRPGALDPGKLAPACSTPALVLGGALLMKKLALAALGLVLAGLIWKLWPGKSPGVEVAARGAMAADVAGATAPQTAAPVSERVAVALSGSPEPSTTSDPFGSLVIHVRWSGDGASAAGVGLILRPEDDPLAARHVQRVTSDESGTARVERIHAGTIRIEGDRGGEQAYQIDAGRGTEVTLDLPPGIDVEGTVTDASDAPIAGAEILLVAEPSESMRERDWLATRVVARTNASGSYFARAVGEAFAVSARAENYVPAYLELLSGKSGGGTDRLDFVLARSDLALRGIVLDPERRPVPGALVAVGDNGGRGYVIESGISKTRVGMPVVETADDGTFLARGVLQTGGLEMPIAVMAEGFPIWIGDVAGNLGADSYCEIVLEAPASIEGVVRDPHGNAVPGARLDVQETAGKIARDVPFPLPEVISGSDGRYRLELIASGMVSFAVDPPPGKKLGHGFAALHIDRRENVTLDVILPTDDSIRGRAQDATGRPLAAHQIRWMSQEYPASQRKIQTDANGRFEITGCDQPPYTLELLEPGAWKSLVRVRDVCPGANEAVLVLPETGSVSGFFFDDGRRVPAPEALPENPLAHVRMERAAPGLSIFLGDRDGEGAWSPTYDEGRFRFERIPPGTYRLTIRSDQSLIHRSEWFELHPGEQLDLGTIRSEPAGSLALELSHESELVNGGAVIRSPDFDVVSFTKPRGTDLVASDLSPGTWYVDIDCEGMAGVCERVEIRPGQETRVRIRLEPGVDRTIALELPEDASWNELRATVRDEGGRLLLAQSLGGPLGRATSILVTLPIGTFVVEATTDSGLRATGSVTVAELAPQVSAIVLELR